MGFEDLGFYRNWTYIESLVTSDEGETTNTIKVKMIPEWLKLKLFPTISLIQLLLISTQK